MNQPSRVRVELYASRLTNVAGAFKGTSDPYAVVTQLSNGPRKEPIVLGRTETIKSTLNPKWTKCFDVDYVFGDVTRINVGIYDEMEGRRGQNTPMGSAMFEVGEILGTRGNTKAKHLRNGGDLFCRITSVPPDQADGTMLQLKLHGRDLKKSEGMFAGKPDPFLEVSAKIDAQGGLSWHPIYRSGHIENDSDPKWPQFELDIGRLCEYDFNRPILIKVYTWHNKGKHTEMGSLETNLESLLHCKAKSPDDTSKSLILQKRNPRSPHTATATVGKIIVVEAQVQGPNGMPASFRAQTGLNSLQTTVQPTRNSMSSSASSTLSAPSASFTSPSSSIASGNNSSSFRPSSVVTPLPPPLQAPQQESQQQQEQEQDPSTVYLGSTPLVPLPPPEMPHHYQQQQVQVQEAPPLPQPLLPQSLPPQQQQSPSHHHLPQYQSVPTPRPFQLSKRPTFVDYLTGGTELDLAVAIDFTGSNGDPRIPGTLHYTHPNPQDMNDYEKAIVAVGDIIAKYDSDQKFPVWGFGAKYNGVIQHCFQVGGASELDGIVGVLEGYRSVFRTGLTMSGPTVFAEVISLAAAQAKSKQDHYQKIGKQAYKVLLILTDGAVSDLERTKQALDDASNAPLSVVIVGIGDANFGEMHLLDDFQKNGVGGNSHRDICQFVEFSKHKNDKSALTRETLAEIPDQLVNYFWSRGIRPLSPESASQVSLCISDADDDDIDLNVRFSPGGEITLENNDGAVYDETRFVRPGERPDGTYHPVPSPSSYQVAMHNSYQSLYGNGGFASPQSQNSPSSPYMQQQQQQQQDKQQQRLSFSPSSPNGSPTAGPQQPAPPVTENRVFVVVAPPNSYPGMQLRVQNPYTGQMMLVAVPTGVQPGGRFGVR